MADIDRIEAQAAEERARLQLALGGLRKNSSALPIVTHVSGIAQAGGRVLGRKTVDAARRNPVAFGVLGLGLGLLVTGTGARRGKAQARRADAGAEYTAAQLRAARDAGLEGLPASARLRVLEARNEAIRTQEKLEARALRSSRRSGMTRTLTIGALALGAGAVAVGLMSGRGRRKTDAALLAERDARIAEAATLYEQEYDQLHRAAPRAVSTR
ncbi:hypothetical protein [Antarctobacter jejuensis]|uniref:hypothetical protein n=1 Tax=Antarctobacter jejuensis TaxID=1439938 RepID=UPI003FD6521D